MSRYHDNNTFASDPLELKLDRTRLQRMHPEGLLSRLLGRRRQFIEIIDEHLSFGDSRAAVVLSRVPLRVSAYSDELDCSVVLEFDKTAAKVILDRFPELRVGDRLITVNTYARGDQPVRDLWNGPASYHRYGNFFPVIANFYAVDLAPVAKRTAAIEDAEFRRCEKCAEEYLLINDDRARNGSPFLSSIPL
ncbi:hypothetical protein [Aeoliella mucimassa]|uniref:Uncharacterized protein n=1 Tax=Aeoliella mucimassa TaxID=2527972 RepID=A0A518AQT4_9BACT|nr:hypothetical protein [Aeoliella mucimassa]QDU57063.1 hypothetical protein Pan181_32770 [Aeoliella mucimassa]